MPAFVDRLVLPNGHDVRIGHATWNLQAKTLSERIQALDGIGLTALSFYLAPSSIQWGERDEDVRELVRSLDCT